jgi:hypothetical protein
MLQSSSELSILVKISVGAVLIASPSAQDSATSTLIDTPSGQGFANIVIKLISIFEKKAV